MTAHALPVYAELLVFHPDAKNSPQKLATRDFDIVLPSGDKITINIDGEVVTIRTMSVVGRDNVIVRPRSSNSIDIEVGR